MLATPAPSALRETALCRLAQPAERRGLRWLGGAIYASALERSGAPDAGGSLRPSLTAAAQDLRATEEFLLDLKPESDPCEVTLAALAERCAGTLRPLIRALEEAGTAPQGTSPDSEPRTS